MNKYVGFDADLEKSANSNTESESISGVWIVPMLVLGAVFWGLIIWAALSIWSSAEAANLPQKPAALHQTIEI